MLDISESRASLTGRLNFESNEELGENSHLWTGTSLDPDISPAKMRPVLLFLVNSPDVRIPLKRILKIVVLAEDRQSR
jgi:hypothetical protein